MPERTGGWPAQQQHLRSGEAMAAGKYFVREHLEHSWEQRQKQRDSAHVSLLAQAVAAGVWARSSGTTMVSSAPRREAGDIHGPC